MKRAHEISILPHTYIYIVSETIKSYAEEDYLPYVQLYIINECMYKENVLLCNEGKLIKKTKTGLLDEKLCSLIDSSLQ